MNESDPIVETYTEQSSFGPQTFYRHASGAITTDEPGGLQPTSQQAGTAPAGSAVARRVSAGVHRLTKTIVLGRRKS